MAARRRREESPGSTGIRCRVIPGGGDPRESATESRPPRRRGGARVKGCGKSAPRRQRWRRQGKPHREQDRIGAEGAFPADTPGLIARGVRRRASQTNGHRPALRDRLQNPAYRPPAPDSHVLRPAAVARGAAGSSPEKNKARSSKAYRMSWALLDLTTRCCGARPRRRNEAAARAVMRPPAALFYRPVV